LNEAKPFQISKKQIWDAFKRVMANRGAAGVDGQSIADFEEDLKNNLYKVWNRLSSGSYFPPPVRRVEIPKGDGKKRSLGIPTVADRIAQMVVKQSLEPLLEPHFHEDSYGYRPRKSALDCNGSIDEDFPSLGAACDGSDSDQCTNGRWTCTADGFDVECVNESTTDIVEVCDGADNDCDGSIDEDVYQFGGFQQPINSNGTSIFKVGRTIPVKISLTDCGGINLPTALVTVSVYKISHMVLGTDLELEVVASGNANTDNIFRYNETDGKYIYNLSTKNYTKGSYRLHINPDDGSSHSVMFSLK